MTPKEYAKQLIEKFEDFAFYSGKETQECNVVWNAKQCALIAVEELIKATVPLTSNYFWQEVKTEIENL